MNKKTTFSNAANNPEFLEDIRGYSSEEIYRLFLENADKEEFLQDSYLTTKKYIRVFLHWYNYEVDFEKKFWNIFFSSTNSVIQKWVISVFLISSNYNQSIYNNYLSSLGYEQLEVILHYFQDYFDSDSMMNEGISPILEQIRTRKEYQKVGLRVI